MKLSGGVVVSAHGVASEAGAQILRRGGNAFDAAVATSLALGVVEPAFSGIGGGGLAVLHSADGEDIALDYRETAPGSATPKMFEGRAGENRAGPLSIATPGLLAGHKWMLEELGTMKFRDVASPALGAARTRREPRSLSRRMLEEKWPEVYGKVSRYPDTLGAFLDGVSPEFERLLSRLAREGPEAFYQGELPEDISRFVQSSGGLLSAEDVESYKVRRRTPLKEECLGYELLGFPPPSAGGALVILGLRILEELGLEGLKGRSPSTLSTLGEILRLVLSEKKRFGDPDFADVPVSALISRASARKAARGLRAGGGPRGVPLSPGSTTHFSVIDSKGNAAAVTETVECYYGSGMTVPGLGVVLNDEMHDFDASPGGPNSIAPMKRPASSMSPMIALSGGKPFLVLGGAGAERIIGSVFQVAARVLVGGMSLKSALSTPRVHPSPKGLTLEGGFSAKTREGLKELGYELKLRKKYDHFFGGVQAAQVDLRSGKVSGAADPRRLGSAAFA